MLPRHLVDLYSCLEERFTYKLLTLFRPGGGGRILPVATLDVNNFFNIKASVTKLSDFFQNLSGNNLI